MKRTFGIISLLLTVCMTLPLLCSCHGSKPIDAFRIPDGFDTSKNYEITFWAKNDTNVRQVAVYEKAIADFEALYPNIRVKLVKYTDYAVIFQDVITNIPTKTTPNICISYPDHIATYLTGENTVVPLDNLINDKKYGLGGSELKFDGPDSGEIIQKFMDECILNDTYYALPFMRSTEALYVNKDYVEKLGYTLPETVTWDFIWEVSEKAMEKDADGNYKLNGQKVMIPFIYKSTDNMMIQMTAQKGNGYATDYGKIELFSEETKEILREIAPHAKSGAFNTFKIVSYPGNYLNAGQCVFAIDSTAGATWMGGNAPLQEIPEESRLKFETAVLPVPQYDTEHPKMISQGPSVCLFNKDDPQEVLASWLFLQFLLTDDVQIGYCKSEGYVPVTSKAQNSGQYKEFMSLIGTDNDEHYDVKLKASQLLLNHIGDSFITPVFNGSANLREAAGFLIEYAVKIAQRGGEADDETIQAAFDSAISSKRLNLDGDASAVAADLGPLPGTAVILLCCVAGAWVLIGGAALCGYLKKRRRRG